MRAERPLWASIRNDNSGDFSILFSAAAFAGKPLKWRRGADIPVLDPWRAKRKNP
jgi:hypothetical protein